MLARRRTAPGLRNESGSALMAVMWGVVVSLILGLTVLQFGVQDATLAIGEAERLEAFYLAESGLSRAQTWLEAQDDPPLDGDTFYPFGDAPDSLGGGHYAVEIRPDPLNGGSLRSIYTIVSTGTVGRYSRSLELDIGNGTLANFLYFTNREHMPGGGDRVWFCTADYIDGPVFSNDQIGILGDPVFAGRVSSSYGGPDDKNKNHVPAFEYYNGSPHNHVESAAPSNLPHDLPTFSGGYELGTTALELPSTHVLHDLKDVAELGGIALSGNYDIRLSRPDDEGHPMYGYVSYREAGKKGGWGDWIDVDLDTINGVIYVNGGFSISGTLDGALTVVTNGQAYLSDDVLYRDSDGNGPSAHCDDVLGIISGSDINVENNAANQNDCVIHAAMIALNNSFRVENWNAGAPRGALTVHGSIVQDHRGPVGAGSMDDLGEIVISSGYAKDYHFDERLLGVAPPCFYEFFMISSYQRLGWRERSECA